MPTQQSSPSNRHSSTALRLRDIHPSQRPGLLAPLGSLATLTPLTTLALAACMALASPIPAFAQAAGASNAARSFNIAPGPLGDTLNNFAREAGLALSFTPEQVQGKTSPGLNGSVTPQAGLARLLAGTGLAARSTPAGYVLETPSALSGATVAASADSAPSETTMGAVEVRAQSLDDQLKDDAWRNAGSSTYMTRDEIERSRGTSVGDIFKGTTGVLVGENRNSGGLDINIRGMQGQGRVPILVDGARQETTVYRGYSGVASRSYIDPDLIGGIQIDKGPTLSAQGTGATGGLVTMRTINADDIVRPGQTFGFRVRGTAIGNNSGSPVAAGTPAGVFTGNFHGGKATYYTNCATPSLCEGHTMPNDWSANPEGKDRPSTLDPKSWAGSIAAAKRWEKIDLVAAYAHREQGNYYAGKHGPSAWIDTSNTERSSFFTKIYPEIKGNSVFQAGELIPGTNFESKTGLLKAKTYLPHDQELELSYLRYSSEYSEIMPSQIIRFINFEPVTQPRNSDVTVDTYTSRYHWNPENNPLIDLRANLWRTHTKSTNNSPSETEVNLYNNERQTYNRWGLDLENTSSFKHGNWGESQLRYGLAVQQEDMSSTPLTSDNRSAAHSGSRDEYSAFAAWQYKPVSSVTFDVGLRHNRFKSSDDKGITIYDKNSPNCIDTNNDGACDVLPNRNKKNATAPVASLTWEPGNKGLQFYGRYAEAYRMPSLFESTSGFSVDASPSIILKPEHAKNREVGVNYLKDGIFTSTDKLRLKLAYFRNHTKDYLTRTNANLWEEGGSESSISTALVMRNIKSAYFEGMEFSGSYDLGYVFTDFGVTKYNKIEICHAGSFRVNECNNYGIAGSYINNMVPPKWHGNLSLGTRLFERKLTLGARAIFMGQRTNAPKYNDDTSHSFLSIVPWHSYKVFDFFASYKANDNISVDFALDNFTDRYYLDALGLGLIPAPGRTARLSVTLQY